MVRFIRQARGKYKRRGIRPKAIARGARFRPVFSAVALVIVLCCVLVGSYYLVRSLQAPSERGSSVDDTTFRAALIDALYSTYPNEEFTRSLNRTLVDVGFTVDIYEGSEVTVDFLKRLRSGYKLVIFRMHSALSSSNDLYFFTGEAYSDGKYLPEASFRLVQKGYTSEDSQPVFAVNWGFVKRCMAGKFDGALVVAMGCDGAVDHLMAKEFVNQGAIGYVGWTGPVLLSNSDRATLYLIEALYNEQLSLEAAVERTNGQVEADPHSGAVPVLDLYRS
jgi:hypothetical protein